MHQLMDCLQDLTSVALQSVPDLWEQNQTAGFYGIPEKLLNLRFK